MAKWLERLEAFIGSGTGGGRRIKVFRWLVLLGLVGAALLLVSSLLNVKPVDQGPQTDYAPPGNLDAPPHQETALGASGNARTDAIADVESELESRLKDLLETIVGVGSVNVLVTVESTEETVVQLNEKTTQELTNESDRNGTSRHITQITRDGQVVLYQVSGGQSPVVVKKLKPKVRGVVIVARGAENATVHKLIQEAVSRGLDVPMQRISVVPRKS